MTDSVQIFPASYRVTDANGVPVSGAKLKFYDAGTTTPKPVYSDQDLTTSLGSVVTSDSGGCPTSDGTAKTLIYTGTASYKIVVTDADDVAIATHDNIKGAPSFATSTTAVATTPVVSITANYTVTVDDLGKLFNANSTGGTFTVTLPSAVSVGDGFRFGIRHAGTANNVAFTSVSSQTIGIPGGAPTAGALTKRGETVWLVSDGANWQTEHYSPPLMNAVGVIAIEDRTTTPPGSPTFGSRYMLTGGGSGAWASFTTGQIAEYTGVWLAYTPPTDSGWIAYVKDEDGYYHYKGSAWVSEVATDTVAGIIEIATQSEMETGTDVERAVTPGRVKYHPGVAKAWVLLDLSAASANVIASYNITSVTYVGTGKFTVTIDTDFSSTNYGAIGWARDGGSTALLTGVTADTGQVKTAGSMGFKVVQSGTNYSNASEVFVAFFGDQ